MAKGQIKIKIVDTDGDPMLTPLPDMQATGELTAQIVNHELVLSDFKQGKDAELSIELKSQNTKIVTTDFGRLFPDLPVYTAPTEAMVELGKNNGLMFDTNLDADDNPSGSKSWLTYFLQFVDHDVTLDRTVFVDSPIDITRLVNFRQPRLNLDSLFGGGVTVNSELYDNTGRLILSQGGRDHQRNLAGKAILVESRNDENLIIAQVHVAICRLYNRFIDLGYTIDQARNLTMLHYQDILLNDAMPKFIDSTILAKARANQIKLYTPKKGDPYMPVEFSVAAYRFGHSAVRRAYVMGANQLTKTQVFNPNFPTAQDLRGGRPIPLDLIIQWPNFVEVPGTDKPQPPVNISRKLDILLSSGLFFLPPDAAPTGPVELAQRNLVRGKSYGLPSGQAVANALGFTPLTNQQIGLTDPRFNNEAPLWFYILAEANIQTGGAKLGQVGSTIVADVLVGLLREDQESILNDGKIYSKAFEATFGNLVKFAGVA